MNIIDRLRAKNNNERIPNNTEPKKRIPVNKYLLEILFVVLLALIVTFMFPKGKSFQFADLQEGEVWPGEEIIADFSFPVNKSPEEYEADRQAAEQKVTPVFVVQDEIAQDQIESLQNFIDVLTVTLRNKITGSEDIKALYSKTGIVISDEDVNLLLSAFESTVSTGKIINTQPRVQEFNTISDILVQLVNERFDMGILDRSKSELAQGTNVINVSKDGVEDTEDLQFYQDLPEAKDRLLEALRENEESEERIKIAYIIGEHFLQPNVLYDEEETRLRINDALANVPLAKDQVLAGERIIDGHEVATKSHIDKLRSLATAKAEQGEMGGFWSKLMPSMGKFFLILSIFTVLGLYLFNERPHIFQERKHLLLIGLNLLFISVLTFICNRYPVTPYIIPIATLSIIITIFFDTKIGLFVTLAASLLVGAMRGNEYSITFISIFVGSVAIQTVRKVRTRNWIIRSGVIISLAYIVAILINNLVSYIPFRETIQSWGIGVLNGFLAPGLAYLLIIILESAFDLTTDMTLLELSDFNHPLLRQLHLEAPGTYHHSYLVGLLAESAIELIGGNPLLARVGAFYHDIGKLEKPEYFVENQTKGRNPQEKLTPTMSSLILANHVRRGVEISKEHGLPKEIEAFITQHHGTSLMTYFYQKAQEQNQDKSISENEFRYPGPRPKTRETAIVMLADAVEAASRTLKDPTPSRIKGLVERIIDERFKSGELDESPLTLRDLSKVSWAFQKILNGRFHGRIDYPENKAPDEKSTDNES